jgi:hypothetical protein
MDNVLNDAFRYLFMAAVCAGSFALAKQIATGIEHPKYAWLLGLILVAFISFQIGYLYKEGTVPEPCEMQAQAAQAGVVSTAVLDQCISEHSNRTFLKFLLILGVPYAIGTRAGTSRRKMRPIKAT